MSITEDWTLVDQIASDPSVLSALHRAEICAAVVKCAEAHNGVVSSGMAREFLPAAVNPNLIGNVMRNLSRAGALRWTGRWVDSGNVKSRNRHRPVREWYVRDITAVK